MPTTLDIAGPTRVDGPDPAIRYEPVAPRPIAYRGRSEGRRLATAHSDGEIIVRDLASGAEGRGATYLDALRALA